jgi:hypothetical protein
MIKIAYSGIEEFVSRYDHMTWDGWSVHVDTPNHVGWMKVAGVQKNGDWFVRKTVSPSEQGYWEFKEEDVTPRRTRP